MPRTLTTPRGSSRTQAAVGLRPRRIIARVVDGIRWARHARVRIVHAVVFCTRGALSVAPRGLSPATFVVPAGQAEHEPSTTRSSVAHPQAVSPALRGLSPAARVDPPAHATHSKDWTRKSTGHVQWVSDPDRSSPASFTASVGHATHVFSTFTRWFSGHNSSSLRRPPTPAREYGVPAPTPGFHGRVGSPSEDGRLGNARASA